MPDVNATSSKRLAQATAVVWIALVATGFYLAFRGFAPTASAEYSDMEQLRDEVTFILWIRRAHEVLTWIAAGLTIAMFALQLQRAQWRRAVLVVALAVCTIALWVTGRYLPTDQIMLWNLTSGTNLIGLESASLEESGASFTLSNGSQVSLRSIRWWYGAHTVLIPAAVLSAAAAFFFSTSRARRN